MRCIFYRIDNKSNLKVRYTYGHILTSSSLDVAKPKSLLSVTTLRGSVHLDMAAGAQSCCAVAMELMMPEKKLKKKIKLDLSFELLS